MIVKAIIQGCRILDMHRISTRYQPTLRRQYHIRLGHTRTCAPWCPRLLPAGDAVGDDDAEGRRPAGARARARGPALELLDLPAPCIMRPGPSMVLLCVSFGGEGERGGGSRARRTMSTSPRRGSLPALFGVRCRRRGMSRSADTGGAQARPVKKACGPGSGMHRYESALDGAGSTHAWG